jgi:predicted RNA-binding Zn-ribbon protein involved in translation (DUF1610 family)
MKIIGYAAVAILWIFGLLFLLSAFSPQAPSQGGRLLTGIILFGIGAGIIWLMKKQRIKETTTTTIIEHQVDLTGDVALDQLQCKSCGGTLSKDNVSVAAGAVMISCPYCGTQYQITEEPKW